MQKACQLCRGSVYDFEAMAEGYEIEQDEIEEVDFYDFAGAYEDDGFSEGFVEFVGELYDERYRGRNAKCGMGVDDGEFGGQDVGLELLQSGDD